MTMARPCIENHKALNPQTCRLCWLTLYRPDYRKLWNEPDPITRDIPGKPIEFVPKPTVRSINNIATVFTTMPVWRHGTGDMKKLQEVVIANCYGIPEKLPKWTTVVDIGAGAGFFSWLCYQRGAEVIFAVEPDPDNIEMARRNAGASVTLFSGGVWSKQTKLKLIKDANKQAAQCKPALDGDIAAIPFDDLLDYVSRSSFHGRVNILKMDCGGAEWSILSNSKQLSRVDEIIGEYHELQDSSRPLPQMLRWLSGILNKAGFNFSCMPVSPGKGRFRAVRKTLVNYPANQVGPT